MTRKRLNRGTRVFLACFSENDVEQATVKAGIIVKDCGSYYEILDRGIWANEDVFNNPLEAAVRVREQAERAVGRLMNRVYRLNLVQGKMNDLWAKCYAANGGVDFPILRESV